MSKRDLKKYLAQLDKEQLEEQIMELYQKFKDVKVFYDFAFNPNEGKLMDEAKAKISNEYFPPRGRWPKMRRSTAQRFIKHFISLGVDDFLIADVMFYNIETAQSYSAKRRIKYDSFYKSMLNSFEQAMDFVIGKGISYEFKNRAMAILEETTKQRWPNQYGFEAVMERAG